MPRLILGRDAGEGFRCVLFWRPSPAMSKWNSSCSKLPLRQYACQKLKDTAKFWRQNVHFAQAAGGRGVTVERCVVPLPPALTVMGRAAQPGWAVRNIELVCQPTTSGEKHTCPTTMQSVKQNILNNNTDNTSSKDLHTQQHTIWRRTRLSESNNQQHVTQITFSCANVVRHGRASDHP